VPPLERARPASNLEILTEGDIELVGRLPWSSNHTFVARVWLGERELMAVYKPGRGERPLWDFPRGLYERERMAYLLSEALGWAIVPETVIRPDAPLGEGSLQRFVDADFDQHYFTLLEDGGHEEALLRIAVFDLLANNADRKSGHCLLAEDRIWAIDHGLTFHADPKLRTVIWDFAGRRVPEAHRADAARLAATPPLELTAMLDDEEADAFVRRCALVAGLDCMPAPSHDRAYPWPLV
jgi:uncharacterized repeat protein (TIGR03843 family)